MLAIVAVALAVTRSVTSEKSWVFPHTSAAAADSVAILLFSIAFGQIQFCTGMCSPSCAG